MSTDRVNPLIRAIDELQKQNDELTNQIASLTEQLHDRPQDTDRIEALEAEVERLRMENRVLRIRLNDEQL
jgi:regulator of replication initiation timing